MNRFLKKGFLLLTTCLIVTAAKAQVGYDYAQYDLGFGGSINKVYGDAQTITSNKAAHLNFNYNVSPYVNYVLEFQTGELKGGDSVVTSTGRQFTNIYTAVMFRAQVQAGELIDYSQSAFANALKNLYLSTGIGFVVNHITKINRYSLQTPDFYTSGENNSNEILIPARIGYEFKMFNKYDQPSFKVDLGYQYNFILGDGLDGFIVGDKKDAYSQFTIGIKFAIGGITSYRKRVSF
jgi:hypothetical protein